MKHWVLICSVFCMLTACGHSGGESTGGGMSPVPQAANVIPVSSGTSSTCADVNVLCGSITICQAGATSCHAVPDILIDTGSFGFRVFASVLPFGLAQELDLQGQSIGECITFADGSALWGPVQIADLVLAGEPAVRLPIQVIEATFGGQSASHNPCHAMVATDPASSHFNGILGIGLFANDCGSACEINGNNNRYFSCTSTICVSTAVSTLNQVQNPISVLPGDNNGVSLSLPSVSSTGSPALSGTLTLGIGTESNNTPLAGAISFPTDSNGFLQILYKGNTLGQTVIDTGSNGYFFPDSALPLCPMPLQGFYCPSGLTSLSATLIGANGREAAVPFQIANAASLVKNGNAVFDDLGGPSSTFDLGLPFFMGRTVYIGIEGKSSTLGVGPLIAF